MANKNVGDAFLLSWKMCDGLLPGFHDFLETQHGKTFYEFDECQRLRAEHAYHLSKETLVRKSLFNTLYILKTPHSIEQY